jgi:pimeloyl-ACP methyl ester carboxylesterase
MVGRRCVMTGLAGLGAGLVVPAAAATPRPSGARWIEPYDFPLEDPFAATVVGTPPQVQAERPELRLGVNAYRARTGIPSGRSIPDVFWYDRRGLGYGVAFQAGPAPLVVLVAGTGGAFNSRTTQILARGLLAGGCHVLGLSSPSFGNFQATGSASGVPGRLAQDALDLHRALEWILPEVERRIRITGLHLAGYSLGAAHAAHLARLAPERGRFRFERVLLLNPPKSVFSSLRIVDGLFERHLADPVQARAFLDAAFDAFAQLQRRAGGALDTSRDFLYAVYSALRPGRDTLEALVGLVFRLMSTNLAFVADVLTGSGYLVAPDAPIGPTSSLTNVFVEGNRLSFERFLDDLFVPHFARSEPGYSRERAIAEQDLAAIAGFLRSEPRLGLVTSADDIILAPGELAWLEGVFGRRAVIFPRGGHCGNYAERRFVAELGDFFATGWAR